MAYAMPHYADAHDANYSMALFMGTGALLQVVNRLAEQRIFADGRGLVALRTLTGALLERTQGGDPKLLKFEMPGVAAKPPLAVRPNDLFVRTHVLAGFRLLQNPGGLRANKAAAEIATIFGAAGLKARKGGTLSPKTIIHWAAEVTDAKDNLLSSQVLALCDRIVEAEGEDVAAQRIREIVRAWALSEDLQTKI